MARSILGIFLLLLFLSGCCGDETARRNGELLYSASLKERNKAALELAGCGDKAVPYVPRLIDLLSDPNPGMQSSAAFALRKIDTPAAREALERASGSRWK